MRGKSYDEMQSMTLNIGTTPYEKLESRQSHAHPNTTGIAILEMGTIIQDVDVRAKTKTHLFMRLSL